MKRTKPKKTSDQTADWQRKCVKLGIAVRFSFLREIKAATGCGDAAALDIFEGSREIEFVAWNKAGDVGFYRMKKTD